MKITVLKNKVENNETVTKGVGMAQASLGSLGFPVEIQIRNIDKVFHSFNFSNSIVGQGVGVVPQEILDCVDGSEDIVCLIFDWNNIFPRPTNPLQSAIKKVNCTPIQIPEQWYLEPVPDITNPQENVLYSYFLHEICHAMYFLTNQVQNDQTHFQYLYSDFSQRSNADYYLYLIKRLIPAWNIYKNVNMPPTVILNRKLDDNIQTTGELAINGFHCFTLERPWKNNLKDISCIPKGQYKVSWTRSLKFPLGSYEVLDVSNRSGVRFHSGNFFFQVDGCILLGDGLTDINHDKKSDVIDSKVTVKKFEDLMDRKDFILKII